MPAIERPTPDRLIEILRENDQAGDILCGHAADEIERLLAERRWIPVEERLPQEGQRVLYYNGDCKFEYARMVRVGTCIDDGPTGTREMRICEGVRDMTTPEHRATHWMPLPEPPAE